MCSHERKKIPQLSIEYQIMPNDNIQYIHLIVILVNGMIFRTAVDSHVAMQLCWLWKHFSSSSRIVMSGKSEKLQVEGSSFIMEMPSLQPECRKSQSGEETHYCLVFKIRFPLLVFIRPFEKRTYYAMAMSVRLSVRPSIRPSVRPSEFSGLFFNVLWDINLKLGICIQ